MPDEPSRDSRILIVEDDPDNATMLTLWLTTSGYEDVRTAPSSWEAMDEIEGFDPDLVIIDLHVGPSGGLHLIEDLAATDAGSKPRPIIVVSGDASSGVQRSVLDAGATAFLLKPANMKTLLARVHEALTGSGNDPGPGREG